MPIVCCWRHGDPNRGRGEFGGGGGIQRVLLVTQLAASVLNMQSRDLKKMWLQRGEICQCFNLLSGVKAVERDVPMQLKHFVE